MRSRIGQQGGKVEQCECGGEQQYPAGRAAGQRDPASDSGGSQGKRCLVEDAEERGKRGRTLLDQPVAGEAGHDAPTDQRDHYPGNDQGKTLAKIVLNEPRIGQMVGRIGDAAQSDHHVVLIQSTTKGSPDSLSASGAPP